MHRQRLNLPLPSLHLQAKVTQACPLGHIFEREFAGDGKSVLHARLRAPTIVHHAYEHLVLGEFIRGQSLTLLRRRSCDGNSSFFLAVLVIYDYDWVGLCRGFNK